MPTKSKSGSSSRSKSKSSSGSKNKSIIVRKSKSSPNKNKSPKTSIKTYFKRGLRKLFPSAKTKATRLRLRTNLAMNVTQNDQLQYKLGTMMETFDEKELNKLYKHGESIFKNVESYYKKVEKNPTDPNLNFDRTAAGMKLIIDITQKETKKLAKQQKNMSAKEKSHIKAVLDYTALVKGTPRSTIVNLFILISYILMIHWMTYYIFFKEANNAKKLAFNQNQKKIAADEAAKAAYEAMGMFEWLTSGIRQKSVQQQQLEINRTTGGWWKILMSALVGGVSGVVSTGTKFATRPATFVLDAMGLLCFIVTEFGKTTPFLIGVGGVFTLSAGSGYGAPEQLAYARHRLNAIIAPGNSTQRHIGGPGGNSTQRRLGGPINPSSNRGLVPM